MARISRIKGLIKHPNSRVFWFRRVIPADLRGTDKLGKREIKQSLGTSDLREAEIRAAQLWGYWTGCFDDLRMDRQTKGIDPTREELGEIAFRWRGLWQKADKIEFNSGVIEKEEMGPDGKIVVTRRKMTTQEIFEYHRARLEEFEKRLVSDDKTYWRNTAIGLLKEKDFNTGDGIVNLLIPMVAEAERDAFEIEARRRRAESARELLERGPSDYINSDLLISQILEEYLTYNNPRIQTEREWRMIFDRFTEIVGDKIARKVTKTDMRNFIMLIRLLPTRPKKAIRVLPIKDMIVEANRHKLNRLSVETIRKHVSAVRAVYEWAIHNNLVKTNPAAKMAPKRVPVEQKRRPFSTTDLVQIFDLKTYYDYPTDNAEFWVPFVSLYTGARIEELAQLHHADIWFDENIPVIEISPDSNPQDDDDSKHVKNQSSSRVIPVHQELIDAGFLDFVKQCRNNSHKRVFADLDRDAIGRLAKETSRHFIRYIRSIGITSSTKVFHSFRHTFKDACRDAGLYEDVHDRLTGHSNSSIGRQYGSGYKLSNLQGQLNKIEYPGVPTINWNDYQRHRQNQQPNNPRVMNNTLTPSSRFGTI